MKKNYNYLHITFLADVKKINPFLANISNSYTLKTPENQRFSGVFRVYEWETLVRNELNWEQGLEMS